MRTPLAWHSRATWLARFFVGLHVVGAPRWRQSDVEDFVRNLGAQGASFVTQSGLFQGSPEPSVQVVIYNAPPQDVSPTRFRRDMVALAETLARAFEQDEVIVELQKSSGRTYGVKP